MTIDFKSMATKSPHVCPHVDNIYVTFQPMARSFKDEASHGVEHRNNILQTSNEQQRNYENNNRKNEEDTETNPHSNQQGSLTQN